MLAALINGDYHVAILFNQGVGTRTVHVDDFDFTPAATVSAATGQPDAPEILNVAVKLASGQYTVKVHDIQSANGSTLDPDHATADITVP